MSGPRCEQAGVMLSLSHRPIAAATFILLPTDSKDDAAATEALKFFAWAYEKGAKMADELDYIAMPANVATSVKATWAKDIKDASGKPLFTVTH